MGSRKLRNLKVAAIKSLNLGIDKNQVIIKKLLLAHYLGKKV